MQTNIHPLSVIRSHDPSVRVGENILCLRPRGHWDRLSMHAGHELQAAYEGFPRCANSSSVPRIPTVLSCAFQHFQLRSVTYAPVLF
jgi:hypothetical protein